MSHSFDREYWDEHWRGTQAHDGLAANPHLATEAARLPPGTALDAGCGEGAESLWLAARGWRVTAVDVSAEVLGRARDRAAGAPGAERVAWVEADLTTWDPGGRFDLVTTHYAHPAMPQTAFYDRISRWVSPGGTLLVVAHGHGAGTSTHGHGEPPPARATASAADVAALLDEAGWDVVTAEERTRTVGSGTDHERTLDDVVVRATKPAPRG